ncbi:MAG TPA: XRE family transcriptional regulator [Deltaproteobacteria bacterium]|nr:XRE family transcriptional regulator [Deltaproteobacteria bacterium]HPJ94393.1 XRE family transcriptional regulator [Deltaproteobacteria bacterium]HPR52172.1 XRE family transcriptional regulator [Deltaproteobacteria bacterium]
MRKKKTWKSFGQRIRSIREEKGISLEDLALETGYPLDTLEKIENDEVTPPVSLVLQLGHTFKMDIEEVEDEQEKKASKKRAKSHKKRVDSYAYVSLTKPGLDKHLRAYLVTIEPKTEHKGAEYHHEGEEFVYVLKGGLSIQVGQNITKLKEGGNIHFNSALHHKLSNPTSETTELLVVIFVP